MLTMERKCESCSGWEERTFRDSYTGMDLCLECLTPIVAFIAHSPSTEKDNLKQLLDGNNADPNR